MFNTSTELYYHHFTISVIYQIHWLNVCFQDAEVLSVPHNELSDLKAIGQGGFGVVYKAKHARLGTVVYKELDAKKLGNQCVKFVPLE